MDGRYLVAALGGYFDLSSLWVCAVSDLSWCKKTFIWSGVPAFVRAFVEEAFAVENRPEVLNSLSVPLLCCPDVVSVWNAASLENMPETLWYLGAEAQRLFTSIAGCLLDLQTMFICTCRAQTNNSLWHTDLKSVYNRQTCKHTCGKSGGVPL